MKVFAKNEIHRPGKGKHLGQTEVISPGTEFEATQEEIDGLGDAIWRDRKEAKAALKAMEGVQSNIGEGGITYMGKADDGKTPPVPSSGEAPDQTAAANKSAETAAKEAGGRGKPNDLV